AGDAEKGKGSLDVASQLMPKLPMIEVVREAIARSSGLAALSEAVNERQSDPTSKILAAAAKLAPLEGGADAERQLLFRAWEGRKQHSGLEPTNRCMEILLFDAVAGARDSDFLRAMLENEWNRSERRKPGPLLALLDTALPEGRSKNPGFWSDPKAVSEGK